MPIKDKIDAIEYAYCMGTLCRFGHITLEGIGNRLTNWGVGTTFHFDKVRKAWIKECLSIIGFSEERSFSNVSHCNVTLTTQQEAQNLAASLGIFHEFIEAMDKVHDFDDEHATRELRKQGGGRIHDKDQTIKVTIRLNTLKENMLRNVAHALEHLLTKNEVQFCFDRGETGMAMGASDMDDILGFINAPMQRVEIMA